MNRPNSRTEGPIATHAPRVAVSDHASGSEPTRPVWTSPLHSSRACRAPGVVPPARRAWCERRCEHHILPSIHTFIHTTFMGVTGRSQKLVRRAKIAQEISETGGIIEIRSVGRSRRHAARTMSRAMEEKIVIPQNQNSRNRRGRLTSGQIFPEPRRGGDVDSTRWRGQPSQSSRDIPFVS